MVERIPQFASTQVPENTEQIKPQLQMQLKMADHLAGLVSGCFEQFFQLSHQIQVFSVSNSPSYFWEIQDFYVSQKPLDNAGEQSDICQLRLSESFCEQILKATLGPQKSQSGFTLGHLQGFEVYLLEQFCKLLFTHLTAQLVYQQPDEKELVGSSSQKASRTHILWNLRLQHLPEVPLAIVFSIPKGYGMPLADEVDDHEGLNDEQGNEGTPLVQSEKFLNQLAAVGVNFQIGRTRVKITELNQLATGDIVILEDSHTSKWLLWDDTTKKWVRVGVTVPSYSAIPRFIPATDEAVTNMMNEAAASMSNKSGPLQWENLSVDLVANFQPIKFPIKRLKELSEGLVLELSNVLDNRVMLNVDGQAVAWGELVVVGDKFAVRVKGLVNGQQTSTVVDLPTQGQSNPRPQQTAQPAVNQDDNLLEELNLSEDDFQDEEDSGDWQ